jgi:diamine N-acetyltransferase
MARGGAVISVKHLPAGERGLFEALRVAEHQRGFVATNTASMQQADEHAYCHPLGIYAEGEPVGFAMYALNPADGNYWIYRFMIAEQFQRRGLGTAALKALLDYMKELSGGSVIIISVTPDNVVAANLYRRVGFRDRGDQIDGELIMVFHPG